MKIVRTIAELRELLALKRKEGRSIALVPTMGAFHEGHLSLMRRARTEGDVTVVSLFVNGMQFNDLRDFMMYPQNEERDVAMATAEGVDVLFVPESSEMYPGDNFSTQVEVRGASEGLEGASRGASHFIGVATVVAKLFNIVQPDVAVFGQKDWQQVEVIKRMVGELNIPVRIVVGPTVRESDGLAMSSRNVRLSPEDRKRALALHAGLEAAKASLASGEEDFDAVEAVGTEAMVKAGVEPEYFAVIPREKRLPNRRLHGEVVIVVAAQVGGVRLIDNETFHIA